MKIIISFVLILWPLVTWAQNPSGVVLHHAEWSFDANTQKKSQQQQGVYLYLPWDFENSFELTYDQTSIVYDFVEDVDEKGGNVLYNRMSTGSGFSIGFHMLDSSATDNKKATSAFMGLYQYEPLSWYLGLEGASSNYPNLRLSDGNKGFDANQLEVLFGGSMFQGYVGLEARYILISLSDSLGWGQNSLNSQEISASYFMKSVQLFLTGWSGERSFASRSKGMILFTSSLRYQGGYSAKLKWIFSDWGSLSISHMQQAYEENVNEAEMISVIQTIVFGASF